MGPTDKQDSVIGRRFGGRTQDLGNMVIGGGQGVTFEVVCAFRMGFIPLFIPPGCFGYSPVVNSYLELLHF